MKRKYGIRRKVRYCVVNRHERYDRNYVKSKLNDVAFIPNSKTSRSDPYDETDYTWISQKKAVKYIKRWLSKRTGENIVKVYGDFIKLGWRNNKEADEILELSVLRNIDVRWFKFYKGPYVDDNGILRYK